MVVGLGFWVVIRGWVVQVGFGWIIWFLGIEFLRLGYLEILEKMETENFLVVDANIINRFYDFRSLICRIRRQIFAYFHTQICHLLLLEVLMTLSYVSAPPKGS